MATSPSSSSSSSSSFPYLKSLSSLLHHSKKTSQILQIHAQSITNPSPTPTPTPTPLKLLYALSKLPTPYPLPTYYTHLLFSQIQNPNTFAYNTLIRLSFPRASLNLFLSMKHNRIRADNYTYPFLLKASTPLSRKELPAAIHGEVLRTGFGSDSFTVNSLITSYCRTGDIGSARKLFDGFTHRDLVSWNSMIAGCVGSGDLREAQKLFDVMPERDSFSWAALIDGYGKGAGDVVHARELFDRMGVKDSVCWNSMVGGYCGIGDMDSARELFESMPRKNVISWSVMIDGYVSHGDPKEGLELFRRMLRQGTKPDRVSAVGAITACAQLGALDHGRWVHSYLEKNNVPFDVVLETSLIDMYMKCGSLELARRVFEGMRERNVVTWNAMIVGLGMNGRGAEAIELFFEMKGEGVPMDDLTLLGVLTACTHGGFVEEGLKIFDSEFGSSHKVEHYGCLVDLLGRAGRLEEAKNVVGRMRVEPTPALWGSLLAACRTYRCVGLAEHAVERLASFGADDSGVYVLLSNIYAEAGRWDGVLRTRKMLSERGMKKETGRSVIELDGSVYEFVNGDCSHYFSKKIFGVLLGLYNVMVSTV